MWQAKPISITSCTLAQNIIPNPVCLAAITSEWSPWMDKDYLVMALAAMWKTVGISSPAIKYMFGIFKSKPWDDVKVVVKEPPAIEPWADPAAPASDYIISTTHG